MLRTVLGMLVAGALVAVIAAVAGRSDPSLARSRTIVITGEGPAAGSLRSDTDVGAPGNSPGDVSAFRNVETDRRGRALSISVGHCTLVRTGPPEDWLADCTLTHRLKNGSIMVQGTVAPRSTRSSRLAVTGGTGVYTGARGTETTTPLANRRFAFKIRITTS
jgi:hypothetical protein